MADIETTSQHTSEIRLLPSEVVDQIAAGEVVDRPAHLVKELVENAIDAGATSIEIEYDQGGRRVRVTDDGKGIAPDQLGLALARHATSKIAAANDLWNLASFGFRGEALASIAAVSRLTLQSRPRGAATASVVRAEFGKLSAAEPIGGNPGTTVLVEDLFANVPARLKFLKSEAGESAQIKATLRALALANETVEFRLRTKGRLEQVWPRAESFLERARQVMSAEKLYENIYTYEGFTAHAVFAGPHEVAGNARSILLFVQNRWVQDRGLQAAVIDAFRGLLMHGEFPIATVRLQVPPEMVDVNIHPTKSQVKFADNQPAFRAVNRCLREAIEKAPWLGDQSSSQRRNEQAVEAGPKLSVAELTRPYDGPGSSSIALSPTQTPAAYAPSFEQAPIHSVGRFEAPEFTTIHFKQKPNEAFSTLNHEDSVTSEVREAVQSVPQTPPQAALGPWSRLQVLGQANLTYILAQDDEKLVLVDQHAAHERVAYERLMRAWLKGEVEVQALLLPITIELDGEGADALISIEADLQKLGVTLDQMGPQAVAVRAKPAIISDPALVKSLTDLANEIQEKGGGFALEKKISDLCATMACHSVVRAGQPLSLDQMKSLLRQMDEFPLSSFCPHGRPVSVDYPYARLERDFGRIV